MFGGPSDSVRMFTVAHQRAGNQVEIATLDDPAAPYSQVPGADVHAFGPTNDRTNYHRQPELERWLRSNWQRFDGVIVNGIWQFHGLAARRTFAGRRPYVVFAHGMLDPYFRKRYPVKHLKKLAYWLLFEGRNLHLAEAVCFTSSEEMRVAGEAFPFWSFNKVVVPYGTIGPDGDAQELASSFRAAFPALGSKRYFLFLGRIHPKKGCDLLLTAFARKAPPDFELVMAGPDDSGWKAELQSLAGKLGIASRIHWTGILRDGAKWGAFYGADAFILPSHQENFGIAVADALACGTIPLISDKVNIAKDVSSDGAALVEPDTQQGTESLIERFMSLSPEDRALMKARARVCYQHRYSLGDAAQEVYKALGLSRVSRSPKDEVADSHPMVR